MFARFRRMTFKLNKSPNVKELPSAVLKDFRQMICDPHQNFQLNHGKVYSTCVECKLRLLMLIANDYLRHFLLFDFYIKKPFRIYRSTPNLATSRPVISS